MMGASDTPFERLEHRRHDYTGKGPNPSVFFFQAEDGIRDVAVTGVQTCALPIYIHKRRASGLAGRGLAGVVRPAQPGKDSEQEERTYGDRNPLVSTHMGLARAPKRRPRATNARPLCDRIARRSGSTTQ